jgi:hypothetical protein
MIYKRRAGCYIWEVEDDIYGKSRMIYTGRAE